MDEKYLVEQECMARSYIMNKRLIAVLCLIFVTAVAFAAWKDGVFSAKEEKADERGYVADVKVTVAGGKIDKIEYNEVKGGNNSKWADKAYNANMKKISGVAWSEAVMALEANLIKDQTVDKVDTVSGATELSARFKRLVAQALAKALK
jgi:major membrane immunogen (membrane-anchored lipoprotein)